MCVVCCVGLDTGQTIHAFDTLQERYMKQRKVRATLEMLLIFISQNCNQLCERF